MECPSERAQVVGREYMKLSFERWYPYLGAALAVVLWICVKPVFPTAEKEFLSAAISIGAILTGFVATAKAILAALPSDSVMGRLRASGYIKDLVSYLAAALYACLSFSIYGLCGFFLQVDGQHHLNTWYARGWVFLGVLALLAFQRVVQLLLKILAYEMPPANSTLEKESLIPNELPARPSTGGSISKRRNVEKRTQL